MERLLTDYEWLMSNEGGEHGEDVYQRRVVLSTFPIGLTKEEFEDYVDKKFCDRDEAGRNKIKALYKANKDSDIEKNISFNYEAGGAISAELTQLLFERITSSNEIKISAGFTKCIRRSKTGSHLKIDYWKSNEDRITKALQYLYGKDLKQELITS